MTLKIKVASLIIRVVVYHLYLELRAATSLFILVAPPAYPLPAVVVDELDHPEVCNGNFLLLSTLVVDFRA